MMFLMIIILLVVVACFISLCNHMEVYLSSLLQSYFILFSICGFYLYPSSFFCLCKRLFVHTAVLYDYGYLLNVSEWQPSKWSVAWYSLLCNMCYIYPYMLWHVLLDWLCIADKAFVLLTLPALPTAGEFLPTGRKNPTLTSQTWPVTEGVALAHNALTHTHTYKCTHPCMHAHTYTSVHGLCVCLFAHIYTHTYTSHSSYTSVQLKHWKWSR